MSENNLIVVGGGPAGSTVATLLARRGYAVTLLEREHFPRFQIGESLLPYNNDLLRELGVWDEVAAQGFVEKHGAEFTTGSGAPSARFCFRRALDDRYWHTFQVTRSVFDTILLRNAAKNGVDVREGATVADVDLSDPKRAKVRGTTKSGEPFELEARTVLDASGLGNVVGRKVGGRVEDAVLRKVSFFAHYEKVAPGGDGTEAGNTVIVAIRDAWFWLIPLTATTTSVGIVVERDHVKECGLSPQELLEQSIASTPYVAQRMKDARRVSDIHARKDFSYSMTKPFGTNYVLVGDSAGFLDPIFSTGVFVAMKSAELVADGLDRYLRTGSEAGLRAYVKSLRYALGRYFEFIENFYCREFLEIFLQPSERFGLLDPVIGVLAGKIFDRNPDWFKLRFFFWLVRMQKRFSVIAPKIPWTSLPEPARRHAPEGNLA
jgi:flavin-dependent dehydrogenase